MQAFPGVFFQVKAGDADGLGVAVGVGDGDSAKFGEGLVELGDLVALGRVGIEVVLAGEDGRLIDAAADGSGGEDGLFYGVAIEEGKGAGQAEADGAGVGIGVTAVLVLAAAEVFRGGKELDVDLEADDGLVFGEDVGGEGSQS